MATRKRSTKDKGTFTAQEVGALVESLRHEIRVVAEGVAGLHTKVDQNAKTLAELREKVDLVVPMVRQNTADIAAIKDELHAIRTELKGFDERLKVVESKVGL